MDHLPLGSIWGAKQVVSFSFMGNQQVKHGKRHDEPLITAKRWVPVLVVSASLYPPYYHVNQSVRNVHPRPWRLQDESDVSRWASG